MSTKAWAVKDSNGRLYQRSIGHDHYSAWGRFQDGSGYHSWKDAEQAGYTVVPVTITEDGESEVETLRARVKALEEASRVVLEAHWDDHLNSRHIKPLEQLLEDTK